MLYLEESPTMEMQNSHISTKDVRDTMKYLFKSYEMDELKKHDFDFFVSQLLSYYISSKLDNMLENKSFSEGKENYSIFKSIWNTNL